MIYALQRYYKIQHYNNQSIEAINMEIVMLVYNALIPISAHGIIIYEHLIITIIASLNTIAI